MRRALFVIESRARAARDVARRAIGGSSPADADASLDVVLNDAVDALAVEAQRAGVRLVRRGEASVPVPMPADVSHIVTNVLLNALAFSPAGSEVSLEVEVLKESVTVDIGDAGPGVPPERRQGIFEGHSERKGGAGVGLRHARALARQAGGELALVPSPAGALFRLSWPRVDAPPRASLVSTAGAVLTGTRVLIVEDDEHVTLLLETALGDHRLERLDPADARHHDIEQHDVVGVVGHRAGAHHLQAFDAVLGRIDPLVAQPLQPAREHVPVLGVVIDH